MTRIALHQFALGTVDGKDDFWQRTDASMAAAADAGAQLYVQPELASFQLLHPDGLPAHESQLMLATAAHAETYLAGMVALAQRHRLYTVAGSIPIVQPNGLMYNIAPVIAPDGTLRQQGKCHLTSWEVELNVSPYPELHIFASELGTFAVTICYDVEIPELVRKAARGGAQFLIVPTYTEGIYGCRRVSRTAAAAAEYNQMYVLTCAICGGLDTPDLTHSHGESAAFTPSYPGFPEDGTLAAAPPNEETLFFADLDLSLINQYRQPAYVNPLHDSTRGEGVGVRHVRL